MAFCGHPLTEADLAEGTLRSLELAPRAALLVEWRRADEPWPPPATDDLYVGVARWLNPYEGEGEGEGERGSCASPPTV